MVSALDFHAGYRGFESRSGRGNFQTISTPSSYSTSPGLSIKWTGQRLVTDRCAWVIHESKVVHVQIHVLNNCRCLHMPRVPGSVKNRTTTTTCMQTGMTGCLLHDPYSVFTLNIWTTKLQRLFLSLSKSGNFNCLLLCITRCCCRSDKHCRL